MNQLMKFSKALAVMCAGIIMSISTFAQVATPGKTIYHRAKIFYEDNTQILALANLGVPLDHGNHKPGVYIESDFSENDLNIARMLGCNVEIVIDDVSNYYKERNAKDALNGIVPAPKNASCTNSGGGSIATPANWELGSMGGFYTYHEMLQELDAMVAAYPNLITAKAPISSFQTLNGNPIYWLKISDNPNVDENEPEMLYDAIHHAREPMAMQQLIFYMWYLLENYDTDSEVQAIVDNSELYFIPVLNPDGYIYNCQQDSTNGGEMWRKNRRNHGNGNYGVDNNRNYDYKENGTSVWGTTGVSNNTGQDTYPGTGPFTEVENQAMKWFCENHEFKMALNNHSWDNSLLFPYGYQTNKFTAEHSTYLAISDAMVRDHAQGMVAKISASLYPASGDSDDWMYGDDLATKARIFSFTPEIGNNGFWPPMNEIENTCSAMVTTNLMAAHLITNYAEIQDKESSSILATTGHFNYEIQRLGIEDPANFTVSINPISSNISSVGNANSHNNMAMLQLDEDSIAFTLAPSIVDGDIITYELLVDNGYYVESTIVNKIFGTGTPVFSENGNSVTAWNPGGDWGTTTSDYYSATSSITDSPNGEYSNNENSSIILANDVDLSNATTANLSFYARWDIEAGYDYVQVEVSTNNGGTWIPQCGNYTKTGNNNQDPNNPVYDGTQNTWVKEEISLSDYLGETIKIRFQLVSDQYVTEDGFYFDDLEVTVIETSSISEFDESIKLNGYPNPASDVFTIEYNLPNGNKNAQIEISNEIGQTIQVMNTNNQNRTIVDITSLPKGVYFYRLTTDERQSSMKKFVVQ